ncbi:MAG: SHOCT domain-containing protein [Candidatus Porifericomitaceae bacterium WSBS_2022_MAG_OTU9]
MSRTYRVIRQLAVAGVLFVALVPSQHSAAIFGFGDSDEPEGRSVWQSGEQYVRIVPAEESGNQHPVTLEPALLSHSLAQVMVKQERHFLYYGQYDPTPLLPPQLAGTLGLALHRALAEAAENEEIVFLVQGTYKTLSVLREVRGTTGRAFYRDGILNIVFGEVLRSDQEGGTFSSDVRGLDYETKRATKYRLASRSRSLDSGWQFLPGDGISLKGSRADWVELNLEGLAATVPPPEQAPAAVVSPAAEQERRRVLLDMARMRKDIDQLRKGESGAAPAGDVQKRLQTLKVLHENELISAEEYEAKRREIINEL